MSKFGIVINIFNLTYTYFDSFGDRLSHIYFILSSLGSFTASCRVRCLIVKFIQYVANVKPSFTGRAIIGLMDKLID